MTQTVTAIQNIDSDRLLTNLTQYASLMIENGAEASQVENQLITISEFLNVKINCAITLDTIFINLDSTSKTELIKVNSNAFNLQKVDALTQNTYALLTRQIDLNTYYDRIDRIEHKTINYPFWLRFIGAGLVSMPPFLLFQTTPITFLFGFFLGPTGYFLNSTVDRHVDLPYVANVFGAFTVAFLACVAGTFYPTTSVASLIIFGLLPLFPGTSIVNAIHEIIHNERISGLIRLLQSLLSAGALGVGSTIAIVIFNALF
ncbi:threonine/serine ThrE exporter family protein [Weissella viridescens]|uniref:threonine/serine ThrE exporter family protein n=1 Tax=Weissella viridescens TaxID=1629 RepID=UPI003AF2AD22